MIKQELTTALPIPLTALSSAKLSVKRQKALRRGYKRQSGIQRRKSVGPTSQLGMQRIKSHSNFGKSEIRIFLRDVRAPPQKSPLPFLKQGCCTIKRRNNLKPKAVKCGHLGSASNHPRDTMQILCKSDRTITTTNMTWAHIPASVSPT